MNKEQFEKIMMTEKLRMINALQYGSANIETISKSIKHLNEQHTFLRRSKTKDMLKNKIDKLEKEMLDKLFEVKEVKEVKEIENKRITAKTTKLEIIDIIQSTCEDGLKVIKEISNLIPQAKNLVEGSQERERASELIRLRNTVYFHFSNEWLLGKTNKRLKELFEDLVKKVQMLIDNKKEILSILQENINIDNHESIKELCSNCQCNCNNCVIVKKLNKNNKDILNNYENNIYVGTEIICKNCEESIEDCCCNGSKCVDCNTPILNNNECPSCEIKDIFMCKCEDCNNKHHETILNTDMCKECNERISVVYDIEGKEVKSLVFTYTHKAITEIQFDKNIPVGFYKIISPSQTVYVYKQSETSVQILLDNMQIWEMFLKIDSKNWLPRQENKYYLDVIKITWLKYTKFKEVK